MTLTKFKPALLTVIGLMSSTGAAQGFDPLEEIKTCARISAASARARCYDQLGQRALETEAAAEIAAAPPVAAAAATPAAVAATVPEKTAPETLNTASAPADQAPAAVAATATAAGTQTLPDDIGGTQFEEKSDIEYLDRITSCEQGVDKKWFFFFASGQIWKQVSSQRLYFSECDFGATVTKDFFGYKMQIEGEDGKIRISRQK